MTTHDLGWHAGLLAGSLVITALVQLASVRLSGARIGVVLSLFVGFAAGIAALTIGEVVLCARGNGSLADNIALGLANAVLFVCCWYFYFHFINIGEASLRIRVLREVARHSGKPLDHLLGVYNVQTVVETRVERLVGGGQLLREGGRLFPGKPRLIVVSKAFAFLRLLLLGRAANKGNQA